MQTLRPNQTSHDQFKTNHHDILKLVHNMQSCHVAEFIWDNNYHIYQCTDLNKFMFYRFLTKAAQILKSFVSKNNIKS